MEKICSISGCPRAAVARTWCRAHWKHWRRWGDPEYFQTERPRTPAADRFWPKVAKGKPGKCWEWQAARDPLGYGFFRMVPGEPMWRAHRAAWVLTHGPIPENLILCHRCDNPPCCNPKHLYLGTHADNMADKSARGRSSTTPPHYGESSPSAKVTAAQVAAIRAAYAAGGVSQRELGEEHGISQTQVGRIVRRVRWARD